jgi:plastocyanin
MKRLLVLAVALLALGLAACGGDDEESTSTGGAAAAETTTAPAEAAPSSGDEVVIEMPGLEFSPASADVRVGQKVTWKFADIPHDVVAEEGADFKSEVETAPATFEFTPTEAGTIKYVCTLHPGMEGELKVSE